MSRYSTEVMDRPDFLIIGGGVIGILLSIEAKRRFQDAKVVVLEKEERCGTHASGRNSGVLHAGFYYSEDSLKARFTVTGNREMKEYCRANGLPLRECGKLVVARNEEDLALLETLFRRGKANGVSLQRVDEAEAMRIEPRVKTCRAAIFSPSTATVDPTLIMKSLVAEAETLGVKIRTRMAYRARKNGTIIADGGRFKPGYVINAAGLFADRVARDFGFSEHYRILPFKGLYLYSNEEKNAFQTNIYPVPDLDKPFLGVHFTVTVDGKAKIGPTAVPAFWREHYGGLRGFNLTEMLSILYREMLLFLRNDFGFRDLALEEIRKYDRAKLVQMASKLATGVTLSRFRTWGQPGIRAQLVDVENHELVMDFLWQGNEESFHILNAVSPGFTCAFPFVRYIFDRIEERL